MAFEYNGFIHRDLEPQVRYDAEQVQLLKQADVTINENLQTINTEIDGKLTKPTNPSAESAVTMLADGTVGTKLLSEIGGGGKLYRHTLNTSFSDFPSSCFIILYSSSNTPYTHLPPYGYYTVYYSSPQGGGVCSLITGAIGTNSFTGVVTNGTEITQYKSASVSVDTITDTITEL